MPFDGKMSEDMKVDTNCHVGPPSDAVPQLQGAPPPKGKLQNSVATAVTTSIASIATAYGDISSDDDEEEEVVMAPRPITSSYINSSQGGLRVDVKPPHESKMDNVVVGEEGQLVNSQVKADDDCDSQTPNLLETVQSTEVAGDVGETTSESSVIPSIKEAFGGGTAHRSANTGYDSDGESSDSSSSTSDSSGLEEFRQQLEPEDDEAFKGPMKTRGELSLKDLPPIQELTITVTEKDKMTFLGTVSSIVGELVVVKSEAITPALDQDSILFLDNRVTLGQVFEIFGPVVQPYYSVRFNTEDEIKARGITIGNKVYFASERLDLFIPVNVAELRKLKGSDASWESNNEPPRKFLDFSDDEEERKAKNKKSKSRNRQQGHVAGRKRNRQEVGEFASGSEGDGSSEDEKQTFSGPHWPPRHPDSQQASTQPSFGHPGQPRLGHRGPQAGPPWQQSWNSPSPSLPRPRLLGGPPFFNNFPTSHQGRSYVDPNQQWGYTNPPVPPGGRFPYQGQNVYTEQNVYAGQNAYARQNAYASPFGWNSPSSQGQQQGFMPPGPPPYPGYQPY